MSRATTGGAPRETKALLYLILVAGFVGGILTGSADP
jgi:hypothetical protein